MSSFLATWVKLKVIWKRRLCAGIFNLQLLPKTPLAVCLVIIHLLAYMELMCYLRVGSRTTPHVYFPLSNLPKLDLLGIFHLKSISNNSGCLWRDPFTPLPPWPSLWFHPILPLSLHPSTPSSTQPLPHCFPHPFSPLIPSVIYASLPPLTPTSLHPIIHS